MKKTSYFFGLIFLISVIPLIIQAQVPNGGFETWATEPTTGLLMPVDWTFPAIVGIAVPVTQSASSHSGNFAVRGEVLQTGMPSPGDRMSPTLTSIPPHSTQLGFQVTQRYTELTGFYQYSPVGGDKFQVSATMFHNGTGIGNGVASIEDAAANYTPFTAHITYISDLTPNECNIVLTICGPTGSNDYHAGSYFLADELALNGSVGIEREGKKESAIPERFTLKQNYPNPFNPVTAIEYHLPMAAEVTIRIFDLKGDEVCCLLNEKKPAGIHFVQWEGRDSSGDSVAAGVYFYRVDVKTDNRAIQFNTQIKKMILIR